MALAFAATIWVGTGLLLLPVMTPGEQRATFMEAFFTATSAVTVTGLVTVDTAVAWTGWGQAVILGLIQIGGLGMIVTGTLLVLIIGRRLGLRSRVLAQAETPGLSVGDVRRMVRFIVVVTLLVEATGAVALTLRWWVAYHQPLSEAAWNGLFHSVSAFNNAGFSTYSDNLIGFNADPVVLGVIMILIIVGGLGFPVWYQTRGRLTRPRRWSLHVRLTVATTLALIVVGAVLMTWFEWTHAETLGQSSSGTTILNGLFASVTARTAGFNAINYADATEETLLTTVILMFIGGGSASTAGGIKVTTFVVLVLMVVAEARGDRDVNSGDRRIAEKTQRSAVAIGTIYILLATIGLMILTAVTEFPLQDLVLETVSAIATVGLSTGITYDMPVGGQAVLIVLMFVGRLGAMTLATALALRHRTLSYRLPEGRPIVG
ncbi:MAG: potassium transporter TrkG [Candidatus Nanopelagicales bacterium]